MSKVLTHSIYFFVWGLILYFLYRTFWLAVTISIILWTVYALQMLLISWKNKKWEKKVTVSIFTTALQSDNNNSIPITMSNTEQRKLHWRLSILRFLDQNFISITDFFIPFFIVTSFFGGVVTEQIFHIKCGIFLAGGYLILTISFLYIKAMLFRKIRQLLNLENECFKIAESREKVDWESEADCNRFCVQFNSIYYAEKALNLLSFLKIPFFVKPEDSFLWVCRDRLGLLFFKYPATLVFPKYLEKFTVMDFLIAQWPVVAGTELLPFHLSPWVPVDPPETSEYGRKIIQEACQNHLQNISEKSIIDELNSRRTCPPEVWMKYWRNLQEWGIATVLTCHAAASFTNGALSCVYYPNDPMLYLIFPSRTSEQVQAFFTYLEDHFHIRIPDADRQSIRYQMTLRDAVQYFLRVKQEKEENERLFYKSHIRTQNQ